MSNLKDVSRLPVVFLDQYCLEDGLAVGHVICNGIEELKCVLSRDYTGQFGDNEDER